MPEVVEGGRGRKAHLRRCRSPDVSEAVAGYRPTGGRGEQQAALSGLEVLHVPRQLRENKVGERERTDRRRGLRGRQVRRLPSQRQELAVDHELAAQEVDPVDGDAERLALTQAAARTQHGGGAEALRHRVDDGQHLRRLQGYHLGADAPGELRTHARVAGDEPVVYSRLEDGEDEAENQFGGGGRQLV